MYVSYPTGTEHSTNSEQIVVYFLSELCCSFAHEVKQKETYLSKKVNEFDGDNWRDELLDGSPAFVYKIQGYYLWFSNNHLCHYSSDNFFLSQVITFLV